jgi:phosphotransferase system enzyme I (PtsI)
VGLYRTELLYLIDKQQPSLESLIAHYTAIAREFAGKEVTFRLLDLDSSFQVDYLHEQREPNPALGCTGVRALLAQPAVLRRQLEAILRAAVEGSAVRILVPFVIDASEIRRVKEAFFEVRMDLQRARHPLPEKLEFGAVIETPAAAMGARALCEEVDFLVVSYDSLTQYLLACDRDQSELSERFDSIHPVVLRVLQAILEAAQDEGTTCTVTDVGATRPAILPFLVGAGTRRFALPSVILADVQRSLASFTLERATEASSRAIRAACQADCLSLSDSFVRAFDTAEEHR